MLSLYRSANGANALNNLARIILHGMIWTLFAMILALLFFGCAASVTAGPNPFQQVATTALIDAARIGVTAELAPRVEKAYADGKINYAMYATARTEETAALNALSGLRAKSISGQAVTQQELNDAITTFVQPVQSLADQYFPMALPATQPAR